MLETVGFDAFINSLSVPPRVPPNGMDGWIDGWGSGEGDVRGGRAECVGVKGEHWKAPEKRKD